MKVMILIALSLMCMSVFAASKVAVVKLMRGEASVLTLGKTTPLKVDDWVEDGAVVKTADKSFVKLIFVDKSSMNVGPNSEMKIESFSGKDSGVIDLVKGKIRSQVTKDYLQINKDKSKLFIKTQNAVMGVRGTDFMISTNGKTTSTVLFEGEVVFNKLDNRREMNTSRLEEIVDRGVRMYPGEFSVMEQNRPQPTIPSLMNIQQREKLEKNGEFESSRTPSNNSVDAGKSIVPEGLSGAQVSNTSEVLKTEVAQVVTAEPAQVSPASSDPEGYVKGDAYKPANGSLVNVESGEIIPPGPGSTLDKNTNTFIDGQTNTMVTSTGDVVQSSTTTETKTAAAPGTPLAPTTPERKPFNPNAPVAPTQPPIDVAPGGPVAGPAPAGTPDMQIRPGNDIFNRPDVRPNIVGGGIVTGGSVAPGAGAVSPTTDTTIIIKP